MGLKIHSYPRTRIAVRGHGQTFRYASVADFEVWPFRIPPCQMLACMVYAYTPEEGLLLFAVLIGVLALCLYQERGGFLPSGQAHRESLSLGVLLFPCSSSSLLANCSPRTVGEHWASCCQALSLVRTGITSSRGGRRQPSQFAWEKEASCKQREGLPLRPRLGYFCNGAQRAVP